MRTVLFRGREDKIALAGEVFSKYLKGSILDVGCDQKLLKTFVRGYYVGVDIAGKPDLVFNFKDGLPFKNMSFDAVFAFDVLEHLDDIYYGFDELCRVARRYVIIGLPNMYEWHFRLMFLMGKKLSGKYGLPTDPPADRHRWLFTLDEARNFCRVRSDKNGFIVVEEIFGYYAYKRLLPKLVTALATLITNKGMSMLSYSYWVVLKRYSL